MFGGWLSFASLFSKNIKIKKKIEIDLEPHLAKIASAVRELNPKMLRETLEKIEEIEKALEPDGRVILNEIVCQKLEELYNDAATKEDRLWALENFVALTDPNRLTSGQIELERAVRVIVVGLQAGYGFFSILTGSSHISSWIVGLSMFGTAGLTYFATHERHKKISVVEILYREIELINNRAVSNTRRFKPDPSIEKQPRPPESIVLLIAGRLPLKIINWASKLHP